MLVMKVAINIRAGFCADRSDSDQTQWVFGFSFFKSVVLGPSFKEITSLFNFGCAGSSLLRVDFPQLRGGCSPTGVCGLLVAVTFLVEEDGL